MSQAFLSHSWRDKAFARRLARRLRHRGIDVWIDEAEMQLGNRLSERLVRAIRESQHVLVVVTREATKSRWVAKEIEVAQQSDASIPVIPLQAEEGIRWDCVDDALGI